MGGEKKKRLIVDDEALKPKADAWAIFYGRIGPDLVETASREKASEPELLPPHGTVANSATVVEYATVADNSTVAKTAAEQEKFATVERSATVKPAQDSTVANLATVEFSSTVALSSTTQFYTYWFRYAVISHWLEDHLQPLMSPVTWVVYKRLFRLAYGFRENQGYCDVGLTALANSCNISKRKAQDVIYDLCKSGCITRVQTFNEGPKGKRGTRYHVLIPKAALDHLEQIQQQYNRAKTVADNATVEQSATVAGPATVESPAPNINIDDDDSKINHHHKGLVKDIYLKATSNRWTKGDDGAYQKIKDIPVEIIEQGIRQAKERAASRPNSLNYFVKEILSLANPSDQTRLARKNALERIVSLVRERHVGARPGHFADFVEDVKRECARQGVPFDNDLFNQIIGL